MPATETPTMSPAGVRVAQKLDALRQVQSQAEHRVKIGTQLLKAAEAHTQHTRSYVEEVRAEQNELREKLEKDVAAALHQYDQWVGTIDENLTRRLEKIEHRLDAVELHWIELESRVSKLMKRSEALMDRSQAIIEVVAELEDEEVPDEMETITGDPSLVSSAQAAMAPVTNAADIPSHVKESTPAAPLGDRANDNLYSRLIRDLKNRD
ncbi:MAG: hypothetical protein WD768_06255 [Phycisphaeraceae bacterium]